MNTYTSTSTYTSPLQSVALGKFLPLESADMYYHTYPSYKCWHGVPNIGKADLKDDQMPCWSLAALFNVLPHSINNYIPTLRVVNDSYCCAYSSKENYGDWLWFYANNSIDACYKMILKLHELNLL